MMHLIASSNPVGRAGIQEKHKKLCRELLGFPLSWRPKAVGQKKLSIDAFSAMVSFTRCFPPGMKQCQVVYSNWPIEDQDEIERESDSIMMEFNPEKLPYDDLLDKVVPILIASWNPYLIDLCSSDIFLSKDGSNLKDKIYRVSPVQFFGADLLRSIFRKSTKQVAKVLRNMAESIAVYDNGIYIIFTRDFISLKEAKVLNREVLKRLRS